MPSSPSEWKRTFEILEKYESAVEGLSHATHDEVYLGIEADELTPEDAQELNKLGWNDYGMGLTTFV